MATGNDNTKFNKLSYWEERYKEEEQREWLGGYESLKSLIEPLLRPNDQILILGCGNSSLGSDLYGNGFRHVTNVDYSSCVIEKMRGKCADMPEMEWLCRDILKPMGFEPNSFDVVIEKATLDSFLVGEKNPWRISQESKDLISSILE